MVSAGRRRDHGPDADRVAHDVGELGHRPPFRRCGEGQDRFDLDRRQERPGVDRRGSERVHAVQGDAADDVRLGEVAHGDHHPLGTGVTGRGSIGITPATGRTRPSSPSSPMYTIRSETRGATSAPREHRHRDREVEAGAPLRDRRRGQVDRDPSGGSGQPAFARAARTRSRASPSDVSATR